MTESFRAAGIVERVFEVLLHVLPLLQTLVREENGEFVLFPKLEILIITDAPNHITGHRYLALKMWLLHVVRTRRRAQRLIKEVLVTRDLEWMDVWEEMGKETSTSVSFYGSP